MRLWLTSRTVFLTRCRARIVYVLIEEECGQVLKLTLNVKTNYSYVSLTSCYLQLTNLKN